MWTNQDGRIMKVLGSAVEQSKRFGDFLIVKIGDEKTKKAFYFEIYLIDRVNESQRVDTARPELPMKLMPAYNINILLSRTAWYSDAFVVEGVAMKELPNKIVFTVDHRAYQRYFWKQSDYSRADQSVRIASPWLGGEVVYITLSRDYKVDYSDRVYFGPPRVLSNK